MLTKQCFIDNFSVANRIKGFEITDAELKLIYLVVKDKFEDDEFRDITLKVIEEETTYGKILDISYWINRKKNEYAGMSEVQKTYHYFKKKKSGVNLMRVLREFQMMKTDTDVLTILSKDKALDRLLKDDFERYDFNELLEKYNTPLVEEKRSEATMIQFTPTIKRMA